MCVHRQPASSACRGANTYERPPSRDRRRSRARRLPSGPRARVPQGRRRPVERRICWSLYCRQRGRVKDFRAGDSNLSTRPCVWLRLALTSTRGATAAIPAGRCRGHGCTHTWVHCGARAGERAADLIAPQCGMPRRHTQQSAALARMPTRRRASEQANGQGARAGKYPDEEKRKNTDTKLQASLTVPRILAGTPCTPEAAPPSESSAA